MTTPENTPPDEETEVRSKTLIVLGLTFILPIVITLVAVYTLL